MGVMHARGYLQVTCRRCLRDGGAGGGGRGRGRVTLNWRVARQLHRPRVRALLRAHDQYWRRGRSPRAQTIYPQLPGSQAKEADPKLSCHLEPDLSRLAALLVC